MAKRYAKALSEDNIDRPTTELHKANNAMVSQILMETLISDDIEPAKKIKAANSIAQLQSAQVRNEKLKIDARKASGEINLALNTIKTRVFEEISKDYPEVATKIIEITDKIAHEMT